MGNEGIEEEKDYLSVSVSYPHDGKNISVLIECAYGKIKEQKRIGESINHFT